MHKRYKRSKGIRRRTKLKASNAGPLLALTATIIGVLGALALIIFVLVPFLLPLLGIQFEAPWEPTPTPSPTPRPTPTPHPLTTVTDLMELQHEIVLTNANGYQWFADPYAHGDTLCFTAGKLEDGNIYMDILFFWNMDTGEQTQFDAPLEYDSYVYPVYNDKWLVYLDGKATGGGVIRATNLESGETKFIKEVYVGQPKIALDGDYIAWMERTGSRMDKVFVLDLNTLESTAVRTFNNIAYGQSHVSLAGGELIYADIGEDDTGAGGSITSTIMRTKLSTGENTEYDSPTYVHDPLTNGIQWVWRDGSHGPGDNLYWTQNLNTPTKLQEDIVDYGLARTFTAYSKDEAIFVYLFASGKTVRITPDGEKVQLLGVSNGVVMWMDVTSRERDILKYARIDETHAR